MIDDCRLKIDVSLQSEIFNLQSSMKKLPFDRRIQLLAATAALPATVTALGLLWTGNFASRTQWTLTVAIVLFWFGCAVVVRDRVVLPLQTVSNLLSAMRENDFSIRARGGRRDDPLGEVLLEVNALTETLREQRLGALEATALLRKVMQEIDVAVFAFDSEERLKLTNRAGERLLGQPEPRLLERSAAELGLAECLRAEAPQVLEASFPGGSGRWDVRPSVFRQGGLPHRLLVIADLRRTLREEERQAWQRLLRVLGHELNNSLAPIQSIAGSLGQALSSEALPADWREDMRQGLSVIGSRAEALSRFTGAYAKLARLPQPRPQTLEIGELARRVAGLETRVSVAVVPGPSACVSADPDQLEQLLINLVRNATDAALETEGGVALAWQRVAGDPLQLEIRVEDEGPGLSSTANLFVPFFTTKPGGSGIGLVLSRQIAETHGGTLVLENRPGTRGAVARLRLPLSSSGAQSRRSESR
jgi:nitrogen fixation/metabolism regulation signal transduction histidine kinase